MMRAMQRALCLLAMVVLVTVAVAITQLPALRGGTLAGDTGFADHSDQMFWGAIFLTAAWYVGRGMFRRGTSPQG